MVFEEYDRTIDTRIDDLNEHEITYAMESVHLQNRKEPQDPLP